MKTFRKMENPVFNETAGTVKEIKIKVGDKVNEGDVLAVIEQKTIARKLLPLRKVYMA